MKILAKRIWVDGKPIDFTYRLDGKCRTVVMPTVVLKKVHPAFEHECERAHRYICGEIKFEEL